MSQKINPPWAWMNERTLVEAHGRRRVILMPRSQRTMIKTELVTCDENGTLVPLDPTSLTGRTIAKAAEMRETLRSIRRRACIDGFESPEEIATWLNECFQLAGNMLRDIEDDPS